MTATNTDAVPPNTEQPYAYELFLPNGDCSLVYAAYLANYATVEERACERVPLYQRPASEVQAYHIAAPAKAVLLSGELVELGGNENGMGDMALDIGARIVSISGLSVTETKTLAPFLFQQITLTAAPKDCTGAPADCPNNEGYGCGCSLASSAGDQEVGS